MQLLRIIVQRITLSSRFLLLFNNTLVVCKAVEGTMVRCWYHHAINVQGIIAMMVSALYALMTIIESIGRL